MSEVSIKGLDKARVLRTLYNHARAQGVGFLQSCSKDMTRDEAVIILDVETNFDYIRGRSVKINLSGNSFDPWLYNRDNGDGAAERIIEGLK